MQLTIIFVMAFLMILSGLVSYLYDHSTLPFLTLYVLLCYQTNRYKIIFCGIVCILLPILAGIVEGVRTNISILDHLDSIMKLLYFVLFFFASAFKEEKDAKFQFLKQTKLKKEFKKSKTIFNILLPEFVRERIRNGQTFISEDQGVVTIIFIDIQDFDDVVKVYQPGELIEFLDKMYNAFDQMCNIHSLQKIETVGKTYMACGGLKAIEKNYNKNRAIKHHTVRILNMGFEILDYVKKRTLKNGNPLQVKIGVHTGPVISGVVGQHKPQFSLVGDTVNRTSRMCSKGVCNRIHMTEDTQKFLKHLPDLKFESKKTDAKGIGLITTYLVARKRSAARHQNNDIQSVDYVDDEEEEKESHVSEMFNNSDDTQRIIERENEPQIPVENPNMNQANNPGNIEHSMIIEKEYSDDGNGQENDRNKNITFEMPKYLI